MLIVAAWWLWLDNTRRSHTIIALILLFVGSVFLQLSLIYADRFDVAAELIDRTLSNQASGFFEAAAEIDDANQLLRNYPRVMPLFTSEHARTHPPGMVLANWATIQLMSGMDSLAESMADLIQPLRCMDLWLLNRPAAVSAALGVWSILPVLFGAVTVFPAYAVGKQLLNGKASRLATILAVTMPSLLLFAPKSVQLYAPLGLLLFWLYHSGLFRQSISRLLAAGLIASLLSFLNLGNGTLLLPLALYTLFVVIFLFRPGKVDDLWPQTPGLIVKQLLAFSLGAASIWLLLWLVWDVPPWEIAGVGLGQHFELVTNLRNYGWWTGWNLIDLAIFSGWPVALGFLGSLLLVVKLWQAGRLQAVDLLAMSLVIFILVLDFSGSARGEVGRIWLFFMPLIAFPAARYWHRLMPGKWRLMTVVTLRLLMVLCLGWAWRPVRAVIVVAEAPPSLEAKAEVQLDARFTDEPIALVGYTLETTMSETGESLPVTLFWEACGAASRPYTVFNHLVDGNGALGAQQDGWPVAGQWPPTCWHDGDVIVDKHIIMLPDDLDPGSYRLLTGLYDATTGKRLLLVDGRDAVEIGTLEIVP
jgi:hypothetical protein